ncbi:hypothetical protein Sango_2977800 [Sesamum angolense]|uniref:RNase H type-1 domain-containing protein n=1 Tax=Sesamum angolense TaxID=2727404 RepID=A0AAE1T4D1_9LAMI|nr:hypothetical protein Sango_2977800 [Sesamum angolense]
MAVVLSASLYRTLDALSRGPRLGTFQTIPQRNVAIFEGAPFKLNRIISRTLNYLHLLGVVGSGGIIRNHLGQTVLAFQEYLGLTSNTAAKLKAIYRGVKLCIDNNIRKIWVETDTNVAIKLISSPSQGSWHIQNLMQQIRNLLSQTEFMTSHIFREGNQVEIILLTKHVSISILPSYLLITSQEMFSPFLFGYLLVLSLHVVLVRL